MKFIVMDIQYERERLYKIYKWIRHASCSFGKGASPYVTKDRRLGVSARQSPTHQRTDRLSWLQETPMLPVLYMYVTSAE